MKTPEEKAEHKKIIKQIYRLCEKQYRKGFQQGFYACNEKKLTKEKVDKFRENGMIENYSKVVNPLMGYSEVPSHRISSEIKMPDMNELSRFLNAL
jgi:hypothetical protein